MVKKDSFLSLTMLIDFFQIAVYLTLFCFKRYLLKHDYSYPFSVLFCSLSVFSVFV